MNLIIDIGNTSTKTALMLGDEVVEIQSHQSDEMAIEWIQQKQFNKSIISSVKSPNNTLFEFVSKKSTCLNFDHHTKIPISNLYETPATLGMDRLAAAIATSYLFPHQNSLSIDIGTCIKYNFLQADHSFLGGAISPGIKMRFKSMNDDTAQLPLIQNEKTDHDLIGASTTTSLQSGVINGLIFEIDGFINAYKASYKDLNVVITGGDSSYLVKDLKNSIFAEPYLIIKGLNYILENNS